MPLVEGQTEALARYAAEVLPVGEGVGKFDPFIIDGPIFDGESEAERERVARRLYFFVMAHLDGVAEPEEFRVYEWVGYFPGDAHGRGREIGPGGWR